MLSSSQSTVVRSWVGDDVAGSVLDERYDRWLDELGDEDLAVQYAVTEELRHQLAVLISGPASVTLPDGSSFSQAENIRTLRDRLKDFQATGVEITGSTSTTRLARNDGR